MTYSLDMREAAVSYINNGGSKVETARVFNISRNTLYRWLKMEDLRPKAHGFRRRKIDKAALRVHILEFPDLYLHERAVIFDVHPSSMSRMLKKLNIIKKRAPVQRAMRYGKASVFGETQRRTSNVGLQKSGLC